MGYIETGIIFLILTAAAVGTLLLIGQDRRNKTINWVNKFHE